jgi:hypothetical protein
MPRKKLNRGVCPICGRRRILQDHHIIQAAIVPELRKEPRNLIEICTSCHHGEFHDPSPMDCLSDAEWRRRLRAIELLWIHQMKRFGPGWLPWYLRRCQGLDDFLWGWAYRYLRGWNRREDVFVRFDLTCYGLLRTENEVRLRFGIG